MSGAGDGILLNLAEPTMDQSHQVAHGQALRPGAVSAARPWLG